MLAAIIAVLHVWECLLTVHHVPLVGTGQSRGRPALVMIHTTRTE